MEIGILRWSIGMRVSLNVVLFFFFEIHRLRTTVSWSLFFGAPFLQHSNSQPSLKGIVRVLVLTCSNFFSEKLPIRSRPQIAIGSLDHGVWGPCMAASPNRGYRGSSRSMGYVRM